jgi:adenine-specific DNA-methyltransferase
MTNDSATKKQRGQFFTSNDGVQKILGSLLQNSGTLLEPSAGAGHLVLVAEELKRFAITALELDSSIANISKTSFTYGDFFESSKGLEKTFNSILGNPPFVAWKDVEKETVESAKSVKVAYSDKTNLYHLFIDRCLDLLLPKGELVFIVPKEWLYTTSANPLRKKLLAQGDITHFIDCGEEKLFVDADVPALLIFRFENNKVQGRKTKFAGSLKEALDGTWEERSFIEEAGRLLLLPKKVAEEIKNWKPLNLQYKVRVGIVSGADPLFRLKDTVKVEDSSISDYLTTKGIESFIDVNDANEWSDIPPLTQAYLSSHKEALISRHIAKFTEKNWWKYGAIRNKNHMLDSTQARFYALVKTRSITPFFENDYAMLYSGGVLGIFQQEGAGVSVPVAVKILNSKKYRVVLDAMFITTGNKVSLQPGTLEDAPFPANDAEALAWLNKP